MKISLRKYLPEIVGLIIGGLVGYLYWRYVGCVSGTCTLKSNWYLMIPWGMMLGYLIGALVKDLAEKISKKKNKDQI